MTRDFDPSNEPGTCLYCGVRLNITRTKEYRRTNTITLCCQARIDNRMERPDGGGWRSVHRCATCKRELAMDGDDTENVETVEVWQGGHVGYDGIFCTADCGYRFGRLAAQKGVRYTRAEPKEAP